MDADDDSLLYRLIAKIMHHEGLTDEDMHLIDYSAELSPEDKALLKDLLASESG